MTKTRDPTTIRKTVYATVTSDLATMTITKTSTAIKTKYTVTSTETQPLVLAKKRDLERRQIPAYLRAYRKHVIHAACQRVTKNPTFTRTVAGPTTFLPGIIRERTTTLTNTVVRTKTDQSTTTTTVTTLKAVATTIPHPCNDITPARGNYNKVTGISLAGFWIGSDQPTVQNAGYAPNSQECCIKCWNANASCSAWFWDANQCKVVVTFSALNPDKCLKGAIVKISGVDKGSGVAGPGPCKASLTTANVG